MRSSLRAAIGLAGMLAIGVFGPVANAAQSSPSASSDGPAYYFMLGKQLESAGQNDQALAAFTRAIELDPESAELRAELAGYYARQNNAVDAVRVAEEAVKRDPANAEANRILGTVYASLAEQRIVLRRGDDLSTYPARAVAALEKAKGDGSDLGLNLLLGRLYLQSGAFDKAVPLLKIVTEARPEMVDAAILLSNAQQGAGQDDDAIQTIKDVLAENPESFRAQLRLAELYEAAEHWTEAADAYAKAQAMNAGRASSLTPRRAVTLLSAGRAADAKALVEGALKSSRGDGGDPILLYLLAESQRQLKDLDGARATAEKLVAAHPDDARGLHVLSLILQDQGDVKGAERALRDLISRDPIDANALNSLGYLLAERGEKLDEAITLVERALKIEPDNPSYMDSLGWAYFQQGRLDLADAKLTAAASRLKSSSVVQDHLGDLRFKQQRYRDAAAAWEQALAGDGQSIDRSKIERKLREARGRM
jgi:tetratricopeptide (TPR) repeat protein